MDERDDFPIVRQPEEMSLEQILELLDFQLAQDDEEFGDCSANDERPAFKEVRFG